MHAPCAIGVRFACVTMGSRALCTQVESLLRLLLLLLLLLLLMLLLVYVLL
jgi:hypothetical protein